MLSKMTLAGGVLGVAALAFVGTGSYATFTSNISASNSIKSGTFQLQAVAGTTSVSGPLIGGANAEGQPTQNETVTPEPTVTGMGNTLSYSLANASPGDTYSYTFTVYDVGTLQGQVNQISYAPNLANANAAGQQLLKNTTIEISVDENGTFEPLVDQNSGGSDQTGPLSASMPEVFQASYNVGPNFLQPNTLSASGTPSYTGDENSVTYEVTYSISSSAGNSAEAGTALPMLTVAGTSTP